MLGNTALGTLQRRNYAFRSRDWRGRASGLTFHLVVGSFCRFRERDCHGGGAGLGVIGGGASLGCWLGGCSCWGVEVTGCIYLFLCEKFVCLLFCELYFRSNAFTRLPF